MIFLLLAVGTVQATQHANNYSVRQIPVTERKRNTAGNIESKETGDAGINETLAERNSATRTTSRRSGGSKEKNALLKAAIEKLLTSSYSYLDVPYLWGGTTRKGIDCSAFVKNVYMTIGVELPRVSRHQAQVGKSITLSSIRQGDLMFFYTDDSKPGIVTHVGMYIGNSKIIHASSGSGKVVIADLNKGYFLKRMAGIRRIIDITS